MNNRTIVLFAVLVGAFAALAGTASATVLTSPSGTTYTSTLKATNEGAITFHGITTFSCNKSTLESKVESHGASVTTKGAISLLSFTECGEDVSVVTKGRLEIHWTSGNNGTVTAPGLLITVQFTTESGTYHCVYGSTSADIGTLTAAPSESGHAVLDLNGATLAVAGGDEKCSKSAELTGKYKFVTPTGLLVDEKGTEDPPPGEGSPTSPANTVYTGTFKASAGTVVTHSELASLSCSSSTFEGTIEQHGKSVTPSGKLSTFDFSSCTYPMTVLASGSLEFHPLGSGNATVTSSGFKLTTHGPFGINCLYETKSTDIGTLTGSSTTKATAVLDIDSSLIPRTGDSLYCGEAVEWTGSYTFTTPDYLDFDK